jgi:hypothetical protein
MGLESQYDFRHRMVTTLERDLIGPTSEREVIDDLPLQTYVSGILYPKSFEPIDPDTADETQEDEHGSIASYGQFDPAVSQSNVRYPASMGLTFAVDSNVESVVVEVITAKYEEIPADETSPDPEHGDSTGRPSSSDTRRKRKPWARAPLPIDPQRLDLSSGSKEKRTPLMEGLELYSNVRAADQNGAIPVTLVLINNSTVQSGLKDAFCFFQSRITVRGNDPSDRPFVERKGVAPPAGDQDLQSFRLLYRHAASFGIGHGCSVEWENPEENSPGPSMIWTSYAPRFELPMADSNPAIVSPALTIDVLANWNKAEVVPLLRSFADGYSDWLSAKEEEALHLGLSSASATAADLQLSASRRALERITDGIDCLDQDADAWRAFRLANRAMLEQMARTEWLKSGSPGTGPVLGDSHAWRPFQLAFILLSLESISNPQSPARPLVDLLWFPTGGGKTEAYLGLIAFTVFLRRIRNQDDGDGLTALMRYTLRLLTVQQFQRATLLICCCENIRLESTDLGRTPISIGLWVGQSATPNTLVDAQHALATASRGNEPEQKNPMQLRACPWCGAPLDHKNYFVAKNNPRLVIWCGTSACRFKNELPVYVVDEDIYEHRPTLLVATVDKFAQMPWNDKIRGLFNIDRASPPPELIIQDELHLISGPLGTMTGLYETAVDELCAKDGIKAKILASTATIRRAEQQTAGLFARCVRQFPPPGLDARDSYFAVEMSRLERGNRMYVGLSAPGSSQTTLMIRTYAALLQAAKELEGEDADRDPYWTLVGYFNSLRVLSGARLQAQDDVTDRINLLATGHQMPARSTDETIELTSREPSRDIPNHLRRMAIEVPGTNAIDLILATNMISVGMDIDRLGLMVVMGQPQATSEYIQATSRVGRRFPGLVVVLLNAAKSRDRSHYESFVTYHSALYGQIEASSVTPFSPRARDRALHAVLIALARLKTTRFRQNKAAADTVGLRDELKGFVDTILARVKRVDPSEEDDTAIHLDRIIDDWIRRSGEQPDLVYSDYRNPAGSLLVNASLDELDQHDGFPTLQSLRDVDAACNLYLIW